ncbi:hypothetical protein [Pseudomonas protegens]|uniref:hypothetical protein n=1 Tax=Pseudomonas protegens TaxID=380021 RepID=UPI00384F1FDC
MKEHDSATLFTMAYLELLEQHLKVTWNEKGIPICVIDWISDETLQALRDDLSQLMSSGLEADARKASAAYGVEHIQTVGFGLAPDFDQFVKLGLIYGERVVLWDVIHSRILAGANMEARKGLIGEIACELLMLREAVHLGGIVLLAHPITWSSDAADIDRELRASGPVPSASLGLAMAFSAIQAGLQLHPYTLLTDATREELSSTVHAADAELFSRESFKFQQCLSAILEDERMAFVEDVPTGDFYSIVSKHSDLRRKIREHFQSSLAGLSPQQMRQNNEVLVGELFELFGKRDADIKEYVADAADASMTFVFASLSATVIGQPLIATMAAVGPPAFALISAVRKWAKKPEKSVIIQTFQALEKSASEARVIDPVDVQVRLSSMIHGIVTLGDHYRKFMSFGWTEHRHDYLMELSPEISKAILALLTPDDIYRIVNRRQFQADYIGDYLVHIFELDEAVHWAHLEKSFESEDGFLMYDGDAHVEVMSERQIPMSLWKLVLGNFSTLTPYYNIAAVINFQTEHADDKDEKRKALKALSKNMDEEGLIELTLLLRQSNDGELPNWMSIEQGYEKTETSG